MPAPVNTNNNEVTNNLHLLAASAGLEDAGAGDSDSNPATGTPKKRRRRSSDAGGSGPIKMQTDVVRVPGLSSDLQQQITKFDSSEFDVSKTYIFFIAKLTAQGLVHGITCSLFRQILINSCTMQYNLQRMPEKS